MTLRFPYDTNYDGNILNQMLVTLDGPALEVVLED